MGRSTGEATLGSRRVESTKGKPGRRRWPTGGPPVRQYGPRSQPGRVRAAKPVDDQDRWSAGPLRQPRRALANQHGPVDVGDVARQPGFRETTRDVICHTPGQPLSGRLTNGVMRAQRRLCRFMVVSFPQA